MAFLTAKQIVLCTFIFIFSHHLLFIYTCILWVCGWVDVCVFVWKTDTPRSLSLSPSPLPASSTTSLNCDVQFVCTPIFLNDMQIFIYLSIYMQFLVVCNKNKYFFWGCSLSLSHSLFVCVLCVVSTHKKPKMKIKGNKFAVISAIYIPKINFSKMYFILTFCSLTQVAKRIDDSGMCCLIDCFFELVTVVSQIFTSVDLFYIFFVSVLSFFLLFVVVVVVVLGFHLNLKLNMMTLMLSFQIE